MCDAGKGDDYRPVNYKRYCDNYDRIFCKEAEEKHTAYVWAKKAKVIIHDPDGWRSDRKSLHTPITKDEFKTRIDDSTIVMCDAMHYQDFFKK